MLNSPMIPTIMKVKVLLNKFALSHQCDLQICICTVTLVLYKVALPSFRIQNQKEMQFAAAFFYKGNVNSQCPKMIEVLTNNPFRTPLSLFS